MSDSSFLSRWSRRKAAVREGVAVPAEPAQPAETPSLPVPPEAAAAVPEAEPEVPPPTLADVAALHPGDNIARFVARGVDETVKRAALKTLFADPHFNVMDGLDTYIDDYSRPDPIPPEILRQLRQAESLGLFEPTDEERAAAQAAAAAQPDAPADAHVDAQADAKPDAQADDVPPAAPALASDPAVATDIPASSETPPPVASQSAKQGPQDPQDQDKCA
ncbi:DUF3306 domain-containing protein [Cupriavidus consociatus]|uniref:DUF3306 domain-containing protein n=1 Tax=Cupriavidus consociatus TaxID=2821357 RepID=UPI001AE1B2A9|nr:MULTISPECIES: DUF3306 domain-containing protein [unclassified Cupriavidus]MBP0621398.1 DUF3306 domain-containing protein [Cupriavidus sp. LEh25]MDK2658071.1 DUF3306 domain-containing protein [Cupriavidus sp. LEh21]